MQRRDLLKLPLAAAALAAAPLARAQHEHHHHAAMPASKAAACDTDGTPLQFAPKAPKDANPLHNELEKYPSCPYCGMNRSQFHFSRHLVHYADDLVDGTCSIHCLAISLSLNLDREPKAIYAADFGAAAEPKPLVNVDQATYLIGGNLRGVMSGRSKKAFATRAAALSAKEQHNGEIGDFDAALAAAYADMAKDTAGIRKKREERRRHMQKQQG
ncbi:MAG TPA: nitrous oxide reductase accessory protein NosL [Thiobacillaceae bacterium]|nr:nitrous oxide reductase accessory protein NosL [Thiobacillaceae bacterium]